MIKGTVPSCFLRGRQVVEASAEQLHWNQLRKQFLLDEKPTDFYEVAKAQLGLHSTDYWTPYLSVWARLGDYDAKSVFESIDNGRKIVRTHAFRTTLHVIHIENLSMILSATGPALFRAYRTDRYRKMDLLSDKEIQSMLTKVKSVLEGGPLRTTELKKQLPDVGEHVRSALLMLMAQGEVVRAKANHARSNLTSYALLDKWVRGFKLEIIDEQEAITQLIGCHVERFGPVSVDDIAWWLRQTKTAVKDTLQRLGEDIISIKMEDTDKFMMKDDLEVATSLSAPVDDLVWFLPYEDHFLKAFIDRTRFIEDELQPKLFPADRKHFWPSNPDAPQKMPSKGLRATGEVRPSIWLNGRIIGRWEMDDERGLKKVVLSLYTKVTQAQEKKITNVKNQLEEFINSSLMPISG